MQNLSGIILKTPEYTGSGVGSFLELWPANPVGALETRLMGDRDSYYGGHLSRLIDEGVLEWGNVEEVFMSWLSGGTDTPRETLSISAFETVVWVGQFQKMQRVLCYLVDHFDHFIRVAEPHFRQHVRGMLIWIAPFADNYRTVWKVVRDYLEETSPFGLPLFEHVFAHPKVRAPRSAAEKFLTDACKRIRIIMRKNPEQAACLVRSLEFALLTFFGWDFRNKEVYAQASARTENWLRAQNAHVPFPIR